jgi:mRNA-degrading endonuclease RelE of RelBE toxin-antitoxin system
MESEFPEYAVKFSKEAKESRDRLPAEPRSVLSKILDDLTDNPNKHADRVIPASREGKSFVYMHPEPKIQITYEIDNKNKVIYFFHFSAPSLDVKKTVFISYSHEDKEWMDKLRSFLSVIEQQGLIKFWADNQLEPGKPWEQQIEEVLDSSSAGLLLVSQSFLTSKFITETELPKLLSAAKEKGKDIFWIPLKPSTVFDSHKDITKYQSLLDRPETALSELEVPQQEKKLVEISKLLKTKITKH